MGPILPITLRSRDPDANGTSEQWTGVEGNLTNYRLNSLILVSQAGSFSVADPLAMKEAEAVHPRIASCN